MERNVEGSPLDLRMELTKLSTGAVPVAAAQHGEHSREFLLAQLVALHRIGQLAKEKQRHVVRELRDLPPDERGKWSEIGEALGIHPGAAAKRFTGQTRPRMDKPGYSLSKAAALLNISLSTASAKAHAAEPGAKWLTVVPTNGRVRTEEYRILDLDGLAAAPAKWSHRGHTTGP